MADRATLLAPAPAVDVLADSVVEAEQRLFEVTDAVYSALGNDVARTRQRPVPLTELYGFST